MSRNTIILDRTKVLELQDRDRLQIGAAYQQLYWRDGTLPTTEMVFEFLGKIYPLDKIQEFAASDDFQEKLQNLGLKTDTPVVGSVLTPEQILVANLELSLFDKRSIRTKLEEIRKAGINITLVQFESWRRDPAYQEYLTQRSKALFENIESEAIRKLYENVSNNDMKAIQMALEMTGKYQKVVGLNINLEALSAKLIEIIVRHVDDPEIIDAISEELGELEIG